MEVVRKHEPVGRCIYCPRTTDLTKEHIFPSGLGGLEWLPSASCNICAKKTCNDEQICLRNMWWDVRARLGMRSAHKHPDYPKLFPANIIRADGSIVVQQLMPNQSPLALMLPKLYPPGILIGAPKHDHIDFRPWLWMTEEFQKNYRSLDGIGVIGREFRPINFCRMLAKIAHAKAVADLGVESFKHLLPRLIRRKNNFAAYLVGGPSEEIPPAEPDTAHTMHLEEIEMSNGRIFSLVNIRLFACLGAPVYQVVFAEGPLPAIRASSNTASALSASS